MVMIDGQHSPGARLLAYSADALLALVQLAVLEKSDIVTPFKPSPGTFCSSHAVHA